MFVVNVSCNYSRRNIYKYKTDYLILVTKCLHFPTGYAVHDNCLRHLSSVHVGQFSEIWVTSVSAPRTSSLQSTTRGYIGCTIIFWRTLTHNMHTIVLLTYYKLDRLTSAVNLWNYCPFISPQTSTPLSGISQFTCLSALSLLPFAAPSLSNGARSGQ